MRIGGRPATSGHTGAGEPVEVYGAGSSGVAGLLLRARGSVSWQRSLRAAPPGGGPASGGKGAIAMEVMFERVAGLDVGKESVTVCVRTPGAAGSAARETRTFKTMTGSLRVMRDWLVEPGVTHRGDGVDVDVLEAAVLLPGRSHGGVAAERGAHEGGARAARAMFGTRSGSRSCWSTACWRRRSCRRRRSGGCGC